MPAPRRVLYYGLQWPTALAALMLRRRWLGAQVTHHLDGAQALGLVFRREEGCRQRLERSQLLAAVQAEHLLSRRKWSVKHTRKLVAVRVTVGRDCLNLRGWFNTQNAAFESSRDLEKPPTILVLDAWK